jgi:hypothetical protein
LASQPADSDTNQYQAVVLRYADDASNDAWRIN